jgi:hypothetical protein
MMPTLRRAPCADRKQNDQPNKAFAIHLFEACFPGFLSRIGWVGRRRAVTC